MIISLLDRCAFRRWNSVRGSSERTSAENKTIFEICSTKSDFLFGSFFLCMFIVWRVQTTKSLCNELSFCRGPSSYALWRLDVPADASLDWPVVLQSSLFEKGEGSRIEWTCTFGGDIWRTRRGEGGKPRLNGPSRCIERWCIPTAPCNNRGCPHETTFSLTTIYISHLTSWKKDEMKKKKIERFCYTDFGAKILSWAV